MNALLALPEPPTAVFCANDEMAIGALMEAYSCGVKVPQDISIVGFDGSPDSEHVFPTITTVKQPISELGAAAVRALCALIDGREPEERSVFPAELIIRASTSSPTEHPR